jgi:hypothetical protein
MGLNYNPASVIQGLVMYMDITNPRSYSGSGNTVFNLANSGIAATIITGITYDNDSKKNLNFKVKKYNGFWLQLDYFFTFSK